MATAPSARSIVASDIMARRLVTLHPQMDVFKGIEVLVKNKISGIRWLIRVVNCWACFPRNAVCRS